MNNADDLGPTAVALDDDDSATQSLKTIKISGFVRVSLLLQQEGFVAVRSGTQLLAAEER